MGDKKKQEQWEKKTEVNGMQQWHINTYQHGVKRGEWMESSPCITESPPAAKHEHFKSNL